MIVLEIITGLSAGAIAGALYFLGLLWTTRRLVVSKRPVPLMLGSFAFRTIAAIAVFVPLVKLSALAGLAGLVGFLVARHFIVRTQREEAVG